VGKLCDIVQAGVTTHQITHPQHNHFRLSMRSKCTMDNNTCMHAYLRIALSYPYFAAVIAGRTVTSTRYNDAC
jgi:hypothetical protein